MLAHEFELGGVRMGRFQKVVVESVDLGTADFRTQDAPRPRRDGRFFGRDHIDPPTWTLNLATNGDDQAAGMRALHEVAQAWSFPGRTHPGQTTALRYEVAGEVHQVFGRPRKFAPILGRTFQYGVIRAIAEFVLADATAYLDQAERLSLTLLPGSPAGLVFPATAPFVFASGSRSRQGMILNHGTAPSPLKVTFRGPVVDPRIRSTTHGWEIGLRTTIAYDQEITVDTRDMTVLRGDGASFAHTVTRASDLGVRINPGFDEITYDGHDQTGSSQAIVEWLTGVGPF